MQVVRTLSAFLQLGFGEHPILSSTSLLRFIGRKIRVLSFSGNAHVASTSVFDFPHAHRQRLDGLFSLALFVLSRF